MPHFGAKSTKILRTCHPSLVELAHRAIRYVDFSIISGHRGAVEQDGLFARGVSQTPFPLSKHNRYPSEALDFAPYPINWDEGRRFYLYAGLFLGIGLEMGLSLRSGADWDSDGEINDQSFFDLGHLELVLDT